MATDLERGYFKLPRGTAARLQQLTVVLPAGVLVAATDTGQLFLHDGVTPQNQLTAIVDPAAQAAAITTAVTNAVNALVAGAPGALNTLKELADALGDDPNYATTVATALANRLPLWQPNTPYTAGKAVLSPTGDVVTAKTGFTSGASFVASNWNLAGASASLGTYRPRAAFATPTTAASSTLTPGTFEQVDATGGSLTRLLAAGTKADDEITVKVYALTSPNTVTVQGAPGVTAPTIPLVAVNQSITLKWTGSAWVASGRDNPKAYLDASYIGYGNGTWISKSFTGVQAALDFAAAQGGGTVLLPPGPTYVPTGGFHLSSRVTVAGPYCRHTDMQFTRLDANGFYRPQGIDPTTGLAAYDGAYLVPAAGSTGPMVWAGQYDVSYAIRNLSIFGVDVFGTNIAPAVKPSWTTALDWTDTNASTTSGSTTVQLSKVPAVPQLVGNPITGPGIPTGATITANSPANDQVTISAAATATASGVTLSLGTGLGSPPVAPNGRTGIWTGTGTHGSRGRALIENVFLWGCGSDTGSMINYRSWSDTAAATTTGSNLVQLTNVKVHPSMISVPVSGAGVPAGTVVAAIDTTNNRVVLSNNATATATSMTLTIGASTFTSLLGQVYNGQPAVYVGQSETVIRGLNIFLCGGDGLVMDQQDCQIDGDNLFGFTAGWGLRMTINSGPCRAVGAIDSFVNGYYCTGGAGNVLMEGSGHRFTSLQCDSGAQENVRFGRATNCKIYSLSCTNAGSYYAASGTRYSSVTFAAPAASASSPSWNTGSNTGCSVIGGVLSTAYGWENYLFGDTEAVPGSAFKLIDVETSGYVWNAGAPGNSGFAHYRYPTGWRLYGCSAFGDTFGAAGGVSPSVTANGNQDALVVYSGSTPVGGFSKNGAVYGRTAAVASSTSAGAMVIDTSYGNSISVTVNANVTSMTLFNGKAGQELTLRVVLTGAFSYALPTNVKVPAYTPSSSAGKSDVFKLYFDGATWWANANPVVGLS